MAVERKSCADAVDRLFQAWRAGAVLMQTARDFHHELHARAQARGHERSAWAIMRRSGARRSAHMGIGEACSIASALAWAGGVIIYKRLGETLAPLQLNLLKNLIVLALLLPTLALWPGLEWPALPLWAFTLALISGVLGIGIADTLYFRALNALGAARVGIIGNLFSPFVIALSFVLLGERLNALQGVGFVL